MSGWRISYLMNNVSVDRLKLCMPFVFVFDVGYGVTYYNVMYDLTIYFSCISKNHTLSTLEIM